MTSDSVERYRAFAVVAPGLEQLVFDELTALGISGQQLLDGGVEFDATRRQLYNANLNLRTASRVIIRLAAFKALTFADLERRARRVPWEKVIARGQAVTLRVTCRKSRLYHSDAVAERITRDLVERMNADVSSTHEDGEERSGSEPNLPLIDEAQQGRRGDWGLTPISKREQGRRGDSGLTPISKREQGRRGEGRLTPSSSRENAQLIVVRFDRDHCTVSADSSGAHLHQRGYRTSVTQAPMRETLAAALIMASGWDRQSPLLDPFCGSGTIPIEGALMAAEISPGRSRSFQFMHWPDYDAAQWKQVLAESNSRARHESSVSIAGSDWSASALRAARENAERAGVSDMLRFEKADSAELTAGQTIGWIVSNPPYGVRLGDRAESKRLLSRFGQRLRDEFAGWQIAILAPDGAGQLVGFPLEARLKTTNGGLRVQVLVGTVPTAAKRSATRRAARP